MQMQPQKAQMQIDSRYRVLVILWGALIFSVVLYLGLSFVLKAPDSDSAQSRVVTFALTAIGVLLAIISFAIKQKFFAQAEAKQAPGLVQTGVIIALAFCEAAALLGLLDRLSTGNPYYFVLFIISIVGMLLHFPRREQLAAASYRLPT
jgi:hypothetical protein